MANLYGVASPLPLPAGAGILGGSSIVCSAGTETNVVQIAINPPISQGWYYPVCAGALAIVLGATGPSSLFIGVRFGAGSDWASTQFPAQELVPNAAFVTSFYFPGNSTILQFPVSVTTLNVTLNPGAQSVTCSNAGTYANMWWARAPDQ